MIWDIDPVAFSFGPAVVRYYQLFFLATFVLGYLLFNWQLRRAGASPEEAGDFFAYGSIATLVGARGGHILFYDWTRFASDPVWALKIWRGGLSSHGALLGLAGALWLFTGRRGISTLEGTDRFVFSAAAGAVLVRAGSWFNSESVGRVTTVSWGVRFPRFDPWDPPLRHPAQLYEVSLGVLVLASLLIIDWRWKREERPLGMLTGAFLLLYFVGRFLIEFFKEYQVIERIGGYTVAQLLSILPALVGVFVLYKSMRHRKPTLWPRG